MELSYIPFFTGFLQSVSRQYGIEIDLQQAPGGRHFPEVCEEEGVIRLNPALHLLIVCYNLSLQHRQIETEAVSFYTLYYMYMQVDAYSRAADALGQIENELDRIEQILHAFSGRMEIADATNLQMLFILLHETWHILFSRLPGSKALCMDGAYQRVEELKAQLPSTQDKQQILEEMYRLISAAFPQEERAHLKQEMATMLSDHLSDILDYDLYLDRENGMLEELACDLQAWHLLVSQLEASGYSSEYILQANAWIFMSLYIMDYDKFLQTFYSGDCAKKEVVNPRTALLRHSFLYSYLFTYYSNHPHHCFSDFKQLVEVMEDNSRYSLIASMQQHVEDILRLKQSSFRIPDFEQRKALEQREREIGDRLLGMIP